jgi:hypothetical protein
VDESYSIRVDRSYDAHPAFSDDDLLKTSPERSRREQRSDI